MPYSVSANTNPVNENAGTVSFTITRSGSFPAETLFASTVQNQGFSNSGDYATNVNNFQVSFASGQTSASVPLSIFNDAVPESDETFRLIVQRTADPNLNNFLTATNFTIHDDDAAVSPSYQVSANPSPVNENAGSLTFTITRSGSFPAETLFASTVQNQGFQNVNDYAVNVNNLPVNFAAGESTKTVPLSLINDSTPEHDETFGYIVQRNATDSISIALTNTTFTIHDDDSGPVTRYDVVANNRTVTNTAGTTISFNVTRSGDLPAETVYTSTLAGVNGWSNNNGLFNDLIGNPIIFAQGAASSSTPTTVTLTGQGQPDWAADFDLIVQRAVSAIGNFLTQTSFSVLPSVAHAAALNQAGYEHVIVPGGTESFGFAGTAKWGELSSTATEPDHLLTHPAVDIKAALGTEVDAFADGTVVEANFSDALGWYVRIHHTGGILPDTSGKDFYTLYAHLADKPEVAEGTNISGGNKTWDSWQRRNRSRSAGWLRPRAFRDPLVRWTLPSKQLVIVGFTQRTADFEHLYLW